MFFEQPSPTATAILFEEVLPVPLPLPPFNPPLLGMFIFTIWIIFGSAGFNFFGLLVCFYIFNLEFEIIKNMEEILDCLY